MPTAPYSPGPPVFEVVDAQNAVVNPPGAGSFGVRIQSMPLLQPSNYITQFEQGDLDVAMRTSTSRLTINHEPTVQPTLPLTLPLYAGFVYNDGPAALLHLRLLPPPRRRVRPAIIRSPFPAARQTTITSCCTTATCGSTKRIWKLEPTTVTMVGGNVCPVVNDHLYRIREQRAAHPPFHNRRSQQRLPAVLARQLPHITLTGGASDNYNISLVNGTLTNLTPITCNISMLSTLPLCGIGGNSINATASGGNSYSWNVSSSNNSPSMTDGQNSLCATYQAGSSGVSGTFILTVTNTTYNVSNSCSLYREFTLR